MSVGAPQSQSLELITTHLAKSVSPVIYRNWISTLKYESQSGILNILVTDDFHAERVKKDFLSRIQQIAHELFPGQFSQIKVSIAPKMDETTPRTSTQTLLPPQSLESLQTPVSPVEEVAQKTSADIQELLNRQSPPPRSRCNDLFMRIIEDLPKNPDQYDSVYIYGPSGSGKSTYTQFLYRCLSRVMGLPTGYTTLDDFTSEMVEAIQSQSIYKFRKKFKEKYKAIIIDDFHLVGGRNKTQEELAHMVHAWRSDGIKVFFISQKPLEACVSNTLLQSRLQSGLIIPIDPPDFSLIEQMVINELNELNRELRHHIVNFCHDKITSLHTLKGIINRIRVEVGLCHRELDPAAIEHIVDEFISTSKAEDFKPLHILQMVCQYYQVDEDQIRSKSRKRTLNEARRLAAYLLRGHTDLSLMDIGALLGRDHTTVLHAIQKVEEEVKLGTALHKHLKLFEDKLTTEKSKKVQNPTARPALTLH